MYEGDGISKTGNTELDYDILRWFNDRMICLIDIYIDVGNDTEWDDDYFGICFPRNFIEDNKSICKNIILDIKDMLKSNIVYKDMRLLYQYVLYHIIINEIGIENSLGLGGLEKSFGPMDENLIKRIYTEWNYSYTKAVTEDMFEDEGHPIHFISGLQSEDIFYDIIFDNTEFDIDTCDGKILYYIDKIRNKEWMPYDLSEILELASRPVREEYYKVIGESTLLELDDESFIVQEVDSVIKLLCDRVVDMGKMNENEISNYIEYMLKRLLFLNRDIQIEREALLGFSSKKTGEADMFLYRNNKNGYQSIAVIENKFYNPKFKEIKQMLGYMNMHFMFGITITINVNKQLDDVVGRMHRYLIEEKQNLHILKIDQLSQYILRSQIEKTENQGVMNCYHFVLNLNENQRKEWAFQSRNDR